MSKRILAIDEDRSVLDSVTSFLSGFYTVTTATSAREADALDLADFDLLVVDFLLPHVDGFTLIDHLSGSFIPFVLMINDGGEQQLRNALSLGVMSYVVKPFGRAQLLGVVVGALRTLEDIDRLRQARDGMREKKDKAVIVHQAVGVLIERLALTEQQALDRLRQTARSKGVAVEKVAAKVLNSSYYLNDFKA